MKFLLGQKIGMTQFWNEQGKLVPVTVIKSLGAKKITERDKHFIVAPVKGRANKPQLAVAKQLDAKNIWIKQLDSELENEPTVAQFLVGDKLSISGTTKGKGFAGTIKRHNFSRGPVSHGSDNIRRPGSIGAQRPQRVIKGQKMAGQMGNVKLTVRGNKVVSVDEANNLLLVSGAVPGPARGYLEVRSL